MRPLIWAAALAMLSVSPVQAETKLFGNSVRLSTVEGIELSRAQRDVFKKYRAQRTYFGAFYVRPGTDFSGNTLNFHSFDNAKAGAKAMCEMASRGKPCTLYALTYPKGVNPNAKGVKGLSQPAHKDFMNRYKRDQKPGKYGAFAIDGTHTYGISFGWNTKSEARAAALEFCKADSARALAPMGSQWRKWVRGRGLQKCRLVDVHSPS
ncbi:hypothetical protein [uncultured Sulfitobacter sp.]|uniref:hypothetical protein n=1 Tax=uncultured Sulfitobacter sp. TaxID=191468 RepID=UPI00260D740F|nr:hypothetical protein [uncultured Sulfitobacter sp.]